MTPNLGQDGKGRLRAGRLYGVFRSEQPRHQQCDTGPRVRCFSQSLDYSEHLKFIYLSTLLFLPSKHKVSAWHFMYRIVENVLFVNQHLENNRRACGERKLQRGRGQVALRPWRLPRLDATVSRQPASECGIWSVGPSDQSVATTAAVLLSEGNKAKSPIYRAIARAQDAMR